jgi:hypothetical protein
VDCTVLDHDKDPVALVNPIIGHRVPEIGVGALQAVRLCMTKDSLF